MVLIRWLPFVAFSVAHLVALAVGADPVAAPLQILLMPALALVLLGVRRGDRGRAWPWAVGALAASWVGDSLPKVVPEDAQFLAMVGGFAVAQVLWIVALTRVRGGTAPLPWVLLIVVVAVALLAVTLPEAGALIPAVVIYALLLATTAVVAARHGWLGGLGGGLFVLSDGLIALGAFRPELVDWAGRDVAVMVTYILAQAALVAVVLRLRGDVSSTGGAGAGPGR